MKDKKIPKPSDSRLSKNNPYYYEIIQRHNKAYENGDMTYEDPETGLIVFTALYHEKRDACCNSGCRHCPFIE